MQRVEEKCSTCGSVVDASRICDNCGADNRPGAMAREFPFTGPSGKKADALALLAQAKLDLPSILSSLGPPGVSIDAIASRRRSGPGLYAVYGTDEAWSTLRLTRSAQEPLYVGKKESSASGRLTREHFAVSWTANGSPTGHSTLRRSLAAGLRDHLDLGPGAPRTKSNPGYFNNFGLANEEMDRRLSEWMRANLSCSLWEAPRGLAVGILRALESEAIRSMRPPLNGSLPEHIKEGRRRFAAEAGQWSPDR
jgi:hypothetical protein